MEEATSTCPECSCVPGKWVRGRCKKCYNRLLAAGEIQPRRKNKRVDFEAWFASVFDTPGCWIWPGSLNPDGYGRVQIAGKREHVHRIVYRRLVGPIPEGKEPDHLCRNRACANPDCLQPVTHQVNVLRGEAPPARHAKKTHCTRNHPYSGLNLYVRPNGKGRDCRACVNIRRAQRRSALKRAQATHSPESA